MKFFGADFDGVDCAVAAGDCCAADVQDGHGDAVPLLMRATQAVARNAKNATRAITRD